jgi:MSHA pilin protein MshC
MNKKRGFTTIELVTVIIIVAILAVNIIPKFDSTSTYQAHTHRAQLISALRLTQQRAMQQTDGNYCHQLIINTQRYGIDDRTDCSKTDIERATWSPDFTGYIVESGNNITFSMGAATSVIIRFDWLGRPNDTGSDCNGNSGCIITVTSAVESLDIKIEAEGYIHAL